MNDDLAKQALATITQLRKRVAELEALLPAATKSSEVAKAVAEAKARYAPAQEPVDRDGPVAAARVEKVRTQMFQHTEKSKRPSNVRHNGLKPKA